MKLTNKPQRLLVPYRFFFRLGIALYPTDNSNSLFYNCEAVVDMNKHFFNTRPTWHASEK